MNLRELIELNIIHDNARILVWKSDCVGLGDYEQEIHINHIYARALTIDDLKNNGVTEEMLDYKVKEIFGDKYKYKMGIVIERREWYDSTRIRN